MRIRSIVATAAATLVGVAGLSAAPASAEPTPGKCYKGYVCFWRAKEKKIHYKTQTDEKAGWSNITVSNWRQPMWVFNNGNGDHLSAVKITWAYEDSGADNHFPHTTCFSNNPHGHHKGWIGWYQRETLRVAVTRIHWVNHC
ncbi:hypothetical protein ACQP2T_04090 [Nonomuraea sp. CA-143628]|uniref:hypothetical protein n=1 Tax=Nonomuraea sp. CA-143628 TaxID=3239997 RepID=UPI003D8D7E78